MSEPRWHTWKTIAGDEKIARVYDVLLDATDLSVTDIAQRLKLARTTLYPALDWLKRRGLVVQKESGREVRFSAAAPHCWNHVVEEMQSRIEALRHDLAIHLPGWISAFESMHRPRVRAFEGEAGLRALREEVFSLEGEVWEYFAVDNELKRMAKVEQGKRVQGTSRISRGRVLMALEHKDDAPPFFDRRSCEVRWIERSATPFAGSITFVADRAYLVSSSVDPLGLVIEGADLVQLLKTLFIAQWNVASAWRPPPGWDLA